MEPINLFNNVSNNMDISTNDVDNDTKKNCTCAMDRNDEQNRHSQWCCLVHLMKTWWKIALTCRVHICQLSHFPPCYSTLHLKFLIEGSFPSFVPPHLDVIN